MSTPRSDSVLMRWRNCCGRVSGARCVAPFWWPFDGSQSKLSLCWESPNPPSRCGEMLNGALYPIVLAIGFHRIDRVVVGCPRLQTVHAHAENGIGMARVQPYGRFRGLAELLGIRTIVHDSVVLRRSPGVLACPPDNR